MNRQFTLTLDCDTTKAAELPNAEDETITCADCGAKINWLAVFPKGRCVECHEKHFVMPKSGADVLRAFAGSVAGSRRTGGAK